MKASHSVIPVLSVAIIHMAGCAYTPAATSTAGQTADQPTSTNAATLYLTSMWTVTETPTITDTPTITATPTPPPDLELTNITITPNTYNDIYQGHYFFARIRNNTNKIMILREKDTIFKFTFEGWVSDLGNPFGNIFYHYIFHSNIKVGWDDRIMNCILFPGEEGILNFIIENYKENLINKDNQLVEEYVKNHDGPLGITYSYQSYYHTGTNIPTQDRMKTQNLTYNNENGIVSFDYDVDIPHMSVYGLYSAADSWVILYDAKGKIIDILHKELNQITGFDYGITLHVHSNTTKDNTNGEYFTPMIEVTPEIINQYDHLEVFSEFIEESVCAGSSK